MLSSTRRRSDYHLRWSRSSIQVFLLDTKYYDNKRCFDTVENQSVVVFIQATPRDNISAASCSNDTTLGDGQKEESSKTGNTEYRYRNGTDIKVVIITAFCATSWTIITRFIWTAFHARARDIFIRSPVLFYYCRMVFFFHCRSRRIIADRCTSALSTT